MAKMPSNQLLTALGTSFFVAVIAFSLLIQGFRPNQTPLITWISMIGCFLFPAAIITSLICFLLYLVRR